MSFPQKSSASYFQQQKKTKQNKNLPFTWKWHSLWFILNPIKKKKWINKIKNRWKLWCRNSEERRKKKKKKRHIFIISMIFHIRSILCLLKPLPWTSASPYFEKAMQNALRYTSIIGFNHYNQCKLIYRWFKSGVFQLDFGIYSRCKSRYPYVKGYESSASQRILWEQVVTCSASSKINK